MKNDALTDKDREKYEALKAYMAASKSDLKMMLRMVDAILEESQSFPNRISSPEACLNIRDLVGRIRSVLTSRLHALEDLINILREHGIYL